MRVLEREMLAAIKDCRYWQSANTRVNPVVGYIEVQLHGNIIARIDEYGVKPDRETFRRWPTATTRSRLRALGVNASIKQGQAYIDGKPA